MTSGPPDVSFSLNGEVVTCAAPGRLTLRDLLHDRLGRAEVKQGCAEGVCGACVVLVDGEPRASCLVLAAQMDGRAVTSVAGLPSASPELAAAYAAFVEQALLRESFQCGYCAPGFVVSATHLVANKRATDEAAVREALAGHLCRCTGYQQIVEAALAAARGEPPPPGRPRADLRDKLAGVARYPTDLTFPDELVGRVLWSEHPAARIRSIDASDAQRVPGVELVLTHADIPGRNLGADTLFAEDQPLLAERRVRSRGDAVALVAARSEAAAVEGLRRIQVDYDPEPALLDMHAALAPGAPLLGGSGNVCAQFVQAYGDTARAFDSADFIASGTYESEINDHACMEPECGVARWVEGVLELTVTTLTPHAVRAGVARALALAEEQIRIATPRMGGSFGKYLVPGVELLLALLGFHARRPVRLVLGRDEILSRRAKRHPFWGKYKLGMMRDGAFVALEADVLADAGPYVSITPTVVSVFADEAAGAYAVPNLWARARGVLTNGLLSAPMRGFGSQQINFGIESIVEKAAREAGLDPVAVRARNFARTRPDVGVRVRTLPAVGPADGTAGEVESKRGPLDDTLARVVASMGPRPVAPPGCRVGRGVAAVKCKYGFPYGFVDRFVARVGVDGDGAVFLESDVPDSGTGILANAARLVEAELALSAPPVVRQNGAAIADPSGVTLATGRAPSPVASWAYRFLEQLQGIQAAAAMKVVVGLRGRIELTILKLFGRPINWANGAVNWLKSRYFPYSIDSFLPRTSSSRGMLMVGGAVVDAAARFRDAALAEAARRLNADPSELSIHAAGVRRAGELALGWRDLARGASAPIVGLGRATIPAGLLIDPRTGNQVGAIDHMYASHGVDLAVNEATGEVRLLRVVMCQDVGKMFDPEIVRGQMIGALAMGAGQALWEKVFVQRGTVANATMHDYLIASMLDALAAPVVDVLESGEGKGPGGSKGVGEAGAVAAPIAIAHALFDAVGAQVERIPATPEDLTNLMERTRGRGGGDHDAQQ
jgi:CO/xanthine dehydrogenase Mo-binding subunit/aerobic-type carbon monoxide dehydrogenase small subunit (CoxS/CutS family)